METGLPKLAPPPVIVINSNSYDHVCEDLSRDRVLRYHIDTA
jgi:hypothetical protein